MGGLYVQGDVPMPAAAPRANRLPADYGISREQALDSSEWRTGGNWACHRGHDARHGIGRCGPAEPYPAVPAMGEGTERCGYEKLPPSVAGGRRYEQPGVA